MEQSFRESLDVFLDAWRASSLGKLERFISKDYQAREITSDGEIVDFGYEESICGWEQGFDFVRKNQAHWILREISILPLRKNEKMVILSATMLVKDKILDTANLFFETFKMNGEGQWKLVRSYIEAGVRIPK